MCRVLSLLQVSAVRVLQTALTPQSTDTVSDTGRLLIRSDTGRPLTQGVTPGGRGDLTEASQLGYEGACWTPNDQSQSVADKIPIIIEVDVRSVGADLFRMVDVETGW